MRKNNNKDGYLTSGDEELLNLIHEYEEEKEVVLERVIDEDVKSYDPIMNQISLDNTLEDESALKLGSNPTDYDRTLTILRSTDKVSADMDEEESFKVEEDEFAHDFIEEELVVKHRKRDEPKNKMSEDKVNKIITSVIIGLVVVFLVGGGVFAWDVFFNKDDDKKSDVAVKDTVKKSSKDQTKKSSKDSKKNSEEDSKKDLEKESKKDTEKDSKQDSKKDSDKEPEKETEKDQVDTPEDHSAEIAKLQGLINTENNNIIAKQKELINLNATLTEKTNLVNTLAGQQGQLERDIETEKNKTEDKDVEQIAKWESELKEVINKLNTANGEMSSAQTAVNNANQYITDAGNRKDNYQNQINNFKN